MSKNYTTPKLVENELRSQCEFGTNTNPTIQALNTWIEEESRSVDLITGRKFSDKDIVEDVDYDGEDFLILKQSPVTKVNKVEYNKAKEGETPNYIELEEEKNFLVYKDKGTINLIFKFRGYDSGMKKFRVTYESGYEDGVPMDIQRLTTKKVAFRVLNTLINSKMSEGKMGGQITVGAINIVEPSDYGVNSYRNLREEIKSLEEKYEKGMGVFRYG